MKLNKTLAGLLLSAGMMTSASVMANALPHSPSLAPERESHQIPQGLYISPEQAYEMVKSDDNAILVDVRTPEEWMFVGYSPLAKIMLPSVMFDYSQMDTVQNMPRYMPAPNPNWIADFEDRLADLDGNEETKLIIMCRSASERAAPMARILDQYGYKNVYLLLGGFEGGTVREGEKKGFRLVNGWKNSGMPWTYDIDPDVVYFKKYGVTYE
ncbi:rhodanese-like domain-containing protein [Thiomicrospira cyclica]|uniref:Rhodanese-like protein n=1 Tax=Thiomicrospira cyclica (strain DSM 14477 / JCM 11371 / ALM1) TaxID=717773 RepID=F6D8L5_THICA|nr:rhodanese-like domain-containing protein [Thiomicrospira cyclica]AEG31866.1 Rhodanese-like protein [Thiomicrospira cyclica ALM1]